MGWDLVFTRVASLGTQSITHSSRQKARSVYMELNGWVDVLTVKTSIFSVNKQSSQMKLRKEADVLEV